MHFSNIVPVALSLFASASASAFVVPPTAMRIPMRASDSTNPALTWDVSNFTLGCSPGGCVYSFNILGHSSDSTPGFDTACNGTSTQDKYAPCQDKGVLAQIEPTPKSGNWTVKVEHMWVKPENSEYYALGEQNVTSATKGFKIPVKDVYGVA